MVITSRVLAMVFASVVFILVCVLFSPSARRASVDAVLQANMDTG